MSVHDGHSPGPVTFSRGEFPKLPARQYVGTLQADWGKKNKVSNSDFHLFTFSTPALPTAFGILKLGAAQYFQKIKLCDFSGRLHGVGEGPEDPAALDLLFQ